LAVCAKVITKPSQTNHRPLKVIAFNANGITRQHYELIKQLQELHIDVALLSETYLKPHERYFIPNYRVYRTDYFPGRKGGTAVAVSKGFPHKYVELPPLVSVEATRACIPIDNSGILRAAVYESPGCAWIDADIIELLSFRLKSILAGDLNAKHPFWNSAVSDPSGEKLLDLFGVNEFEISAPRCPSHYSPAGNGDIFNIVVHQNIRLSGVIVSDILDLDHLPIVFHILDHVKTKNLSEPIEKFTDWKWFQSLASDLISPRIDINAGEEADEATHYFATTIASACRLSTVKVTFSSINNHDIPG
jgi:hypothetical protein